MARHRILVFWLTDRTVVRDMLGNYDSLPDTYTLADYGREVAGHDVRSIVWSDAGAEDPMATLEATGGELDVVADLAQTLPDLRIVVDHFGWPQNPSEEGLSRHRERLSVIAAAPNTATRIDAIGTIFGHWTTDRVRPWLRAATDTFGPDRCMLGSDMPIERLLSGFDRRYAAYRDIFADLTDGARDALFGATAMRWYGVSA